MILIGKESELTAEYPASCCLTVVTSITDIIKNDVFLSEEFFKYDHDSLSDSPVRRSLEIIFSVYEKLIDSIVGNHIILNEAYFICLALNCSEYKLSIFR